MNNSDKNSEQDPYDFTDQQKGRISMQNSDLHQVMKIPKVRSELLKPANTRYRTKKQMVTSQNERQYTLNMNIQDSEEFNPSFDSPRGSQQPKTKPQFSFGKQSDERTY